MTKRLLAEVSSYCYISPPKNHFEGFRYANHTFNLLESLRRKDNGKLYVIKSVFAIDCG
jgi:hypothetical protein